ncbi:MAG TPA: class I SAM-dependent methyltransferase [Fibrobacteria bacterium]|nr:class I SAM-dependent methyltransferase [Fibrobacteria bacterium]
MADLVAEAMGSHYRRTFSEFGPTSKGADWGKEEDLELRYRKMLNVMKHDHGSRIDRPTVLDVGCGFGGLASFAPSIGCDAAFTGIDLVREMLDCAATRHPDHDWIQGDAMRFDFSSDFDYVVCNGILTQKLQVGQQEMEEYACDLVKRMFSLARRGIAFNIMSDRVNFTVPNLFYKDPLWMTRYCMDNLSRKTVLDHAYPLYEYTLYVYR